MDADVIERLLRSAEPSVRYRVLVGALGRDPDSAEVAALREEIRLSERARKLLSERDADGRIATGGRLARAR